MKKQTAPAEKNSLKTVVLFILCVSVLIIISLVVKTISMIRTSIYDGTHRFTIAITRQDTVLEVVSFDPATTSTDVFALKDSKSMPVSAFGRTFAVIPDATIALPADLQIDLNPSNGMNTIIWHYNQVKTRLTLYDVLRLSLLAKSVPLANRDVEQVGIPVDENRLDQLLLQNLTDSTISTENVSIQVINASGAPGMGNRLARVISNMGGNVVAVTTSQRRIPHSSIHYFGTETYTLQKLSHLLSYPVLLLDRETIADIVITIGEDHKDTTIF
jgi:hypothetical protein